MENQLNPNETPTEPSVSPMLRQMLQALETHPLKGLSPRRRVAAIWQAAEKGVFISYSRADELFAVELATRLGETGVNAWLDMLDINAAVDWHDAIDKALTRCGVMLAVVSPTSIKDTVIQMEWLRFLNNGKVVQPIIATHCDMTNLAFGLKPLNFNRDFDSGLHLLKTLLGVYGRV